MYQCDLIPVVLVAPQALKNGVRELDELGIATGASRTRIAFGAGGLVSGVFKNCL